jgi:hypothetical protein
LLRLGPPRLPGPPRKGLVYPVVGIEEGGGSGRLSRFRRAAGARNLVETLRTGFSGGADPEGRRRQILALLPSRLASLPPKLIPPPGKCNMSAWRLATERPTLVLLPN